MTQYLLVHGAWHGAWCWDEVRAHLPDAVAIDLPSNHVEGAGFTDDVAAVRAALDGMSDVVLCGHSYGGAVITEAGAHGSVRHLVYLCAFVPDVGETVMGLSGSPGFEPSTLSSGLTIEGDDLLVTPDVAREAFYADCEQQPVDRLVPHPMRAFGVEPAAAAWRDTPSTYVVCTQDRAIQPGLQRQMAARCTTTVELEASHSPMLSMPERVAEILRSAR